MTPEITVDSEFNVAYISFRPVRDGESAEQIAIKRRGEVIAVLDFAATGELLGIELLDAENQLPRPL